MIVANVRSMPNRLYRYQWTDCNNTLWYHDRLVKYGFKNLSFEITEFNHRYQFKYPQLVQIDERYICLIGGEPLEADEAEIYSSN